MSARKRHNPGKNLAGIDFERKERQPYRPGFWGRMLGILLTLAGILVIAWLLFNPVRTRPTAAAYVESFNRVAAAQSYPERLTPPPAPAAGTREYPIGETGLILKVSSDAEGYVTALAMQDDPARQAADGWLQLPPKELRDRFTIMLNALDSSWSVVDIYRAFSTMGIDLDQPLAAQPAGPREHAQDGLMLRLVHDEQHLAFEANLDILEE